MSMNNINSLSHTKWNCKYQNESRIAEYIENQLKEDEMGEQLVIPSASLVTGRK